MSEATLLLSVVGTGIGVAAVVVSVVALAVNGINSRLSALGGELSARIAKMDDRFARMDDRIDALRGEVRGDLEKLRRELREDHAALDARLRGVEIGFAKVDQRLETVERAILPQAPPAA